jgi:homopolymeric O-antigen transport system permease protein
MKDRWINETWQYRELFFFLVWRNIKVRYKQTLLGASWAIIQPFCTMVVFTIFFGKMAKMPSDGVPYPIFSYAALLPWTYFSQSLNQTGNSLVASKNLITKIYFPRLIIPASFALSGLVDFCLASVILLGMMVYYNMPFNWGIVFIPILILPLSLLSMGVGMFFSSLNVKYRDIKHALPFIVQMWLFITPVIYPTSIIPERFRFLVALNPAAGIIETFRAIFLPTRDIDWQLLSISLIATIIIFFIGLTYFRKTEKVFADII